MISSAVRSPSMSEYSFLPKVMMAWSSSSPPTRIDWEVTMPPSEMTATSVVPPPMSTTMLPVGSLTGQPGPDRRGHRLLDDVDPARAGLVAGLLDRALLHPGDAAGHRDDDPRLGQMAALVHLLDEVPEHPLGDVEVGDDAVLSGRTATMLPGVRPIIRLASTPTATICPVLVFSATTEGSLSTMPRPRT